MRARTNQTQSGFTFAEVLIAIVILSVVAALSVQAIAITTTSSQRTVCLPGSPGRQSGCVIVTVSPGATCALGIFHIRSCIGFCYGNRSNHFPLYCWFQVLLLKKIGPKLINRRCRLPRRAVRRLARAISLIMAIGAERKRDLVGA